MENALKKNITGERQENFVFTVECKYECFTGKSVFQWKSWSQLPSITPYTCILLLLTIRVQGLEHLHMTECYSARLEPDILECETKWALGSIAMNKANRADEIQPEQLKILKDIAVKMLHSVCQQIWKTEQWPQNCKRSFSFQSQRTAMSKNVPTTIQLC